MEMSTAQRDTMLSLERGLRILEIFGESSRPFTLTEVAHFANLSKTTTQRFLHTLCTLGYLSRDENKKYALTMKVLSLGFNFLYTTDLIKVAKPFIDNLSSDLNKTINLVVLDNFEILYLYRKEVSRFLKYDLRAGSKLPAYCTAAGKILLAGLTNKELRKRINKMELIPVTTKTITSKEALLEEIEKTRKRGYSICDRELSLDLYSTAVPLLNDHGKMLAAINVTMAARDENSQIRKIVLEKLIQKGKLISELFGYRGPYPKL